jgi:magnesium-protoporphyrin O-methyltransferase
MSEPCACPPDQPPTDIERITQHFDERFRDWEPVCPASTDMLFGWVRDEGLAGSSVLDIGCGTGALIVRALEAGAERATGADLSSEAIAQATALVRENGFADRVELWVGDGAVEPLQDHDVVLLDKVICCYPDADTLIARSTAAAGRLYAFTVPESRGFWGLIARARWFVFDLAERLRGGYHPRFVHERSEVEAKVLAAGFRPVHTGRQFVWFVGVYARR